MKSEGMKAHAGRSATGLVGVAETKRFEDLDIFLQISDFNKENSLLGFSKYSECVAKCVAGNRPANPINNQKKRWHEWQD